MPVSERGRQRAMQAGSQVNPKDGREAAILGGIVRCVIDTGHFNERFVAAYTVEALRWFESDRRQFGADPVGKGPASDAEIAAITKRFMHFYSPPQEVAA